VLFKEPIIGPLKFKMAEIRHLATLQDAATWQIQCHDSRDTCYIAGCCHRASSMPCHPRATYHFTGCCHLVNSLSRFWATCHIAGCSHLRKSMSWSCHIAGCKNSICHIENCFSPYFICLFLMRFRLWRALAFVSSLIHLFDISCFVCCELQWFVSAFLVMWFRVACDTDNLLLLCAVQALHDCVVVVMLGDVPGEDGSCSWPAQIH